MTLLSNDSLKSQSLELLTAYQSRPSLELRNRIVQMNLGLVRREAHRWLHKSKESFDELMQIGALGLVKAVERFDLGKGYAFSSFAIPYIRGEIAHYLRDHSTTVRIPRRWQRLLQSSANVVGQLQKELGHFPSEQEVADRLNISVEEWQQIRIASSNRSPLSLDVAVYKNHEESPSLTELLPDLRYRSFQLTQEDRLQLQQALAQLEKNTRDVIEYIFLRELTHKETAKQLNLNPTTVARHLRKGLVRLQLLMRPAH